MSAHSFLIVDDDIELSMVMKALLEARGHDVQVVNRSVDAPAAILAQRPDCVITDVMMPELDGLELCQLLRREVSLADLKIIVVSGKAYEFDRQRALELGADAYITKPFESVAFVEAVERVVRGPVVIKFWGVRGTLPVPGPRSLRYGGNTPCVSMSFPRGQLFIFDAGTGIKELSNDLVARKVKRIEAKIFLSHPHWDHVNALPFFAPLYVQGNDFEICGPRQGDVSVQQLISAQMSGVYFPVTTREFAANVYYRDLREGQHDFAGIKLSAMLLSHPGFCLGYRVDFAGRSICYITDNELFPADSPYSNGNLYQRLLRFVQGADVLIMDATYSDEEYLRKATWGHAPVSEVARFAHEAQVVSLHLFHHDPDQSDDDIDAKLATARGVLAALDSPTLCDAPCEGAELTLAPLRAAVAPGAS